MTDDEMDMIREEFEEEMNELVEKYNSKGLIIESISIEYQKDD